MPASTIEIGKLRAIFGLDTAQYEAGARKARDINARMASDFTKTKDTLKGLTTSSNAMWRDMVSGMSAAGKGVDALAKQAAGASILIRGMGEAGKKAAADMAVAATQMQQQLARVAAGQQAQARAWAMARQGDAQRVADFQKATAATRAAASSTGMLTQSLLGFGAAIGTGAVLRFGREIAEFASHMEDLSAETGIGVERLQQLNFVAAGVGLSIDDVVRAVNQLVKRVANDDDSAIAALEGLGISAARFKQAAADEQLLMLADALGATDDQAKKTTASFALLGKTGPESLRFLNAELRKLLEDAPKVNQEAISMIGRIDDMMAQGWIRMEQEAIGSIDAVAKFFGRTLDNLGADWVRFLAFIAGGDKAEIAGMASRVTQKPFGLPAPATAFGVPGDADQRELDRRVADAEARTKKLADDRERAAAAEKRRREDAAEALVRQFQNQHEVENAALLYTIQTQQAGLDARERALMAAGEVEDAALRQRAVAEDAARKASGDARADALEASTEVENAALKQWADRWNAARDQEAAIQREMAQRWEFFMQDLTFSITNGFADMLVGLRGFHDGFVGIWQDIRRSVANILSQMLADFIGGYIRRAAAAAAGMAVAGGATSAAASVLGPGNAAIAGATGGAGLAGGGAGLLALATNPFTIAAAAGIGLGVAIGKGFLRGGEEASQVSPRRDRFFGQFGGSDKAAGLLKSNQLMRGLFAAGTVSEWESAQSAAVMRFEMMGRKVQSFATGGFIPPGVVQPAILHGGTHGEVVMPLDKAAARGTVVNNYWTISGLDGQDVLRVVKDKIAPALTHMQRFNVDGYTTQQKLALGIR